MLEGENRVEGGEGGHIMQILGNDGRTVDFGRVDCLDEPPRASAHMRNHAHREGGL